MSRLWATENGKQALQQIAELKPDLVFLDLQMPLMGGFEVVRKLSGGQLPIVVILTAFDQHAIEAFEAGAVDYLLKPVGEERLRKAVERARNLHKNPLNVANEVAKIAAVSAPQFVGGRRLWVASAESTSCWTQTRFWRFRRKRTGAIVTAREQRLLATQRSRGPLRSGLGEAAIRAGAPERDS